MANVYEATAEETTVLQEVFGPAVDEVCFWDAESGRGRFTQVTGHDATGAQLGAVERAQRKTMARLRQMAADRGETVKFWLAVPRP